METQQAVTQRIPTYQLIFPGGDTQAVNNVEYRIPIFGPVVLAAFVDTGVNRVSFANNLVLRDDRLGNLNGFFPQAGFDRQAVLMKDTQKVRMSTGVEVQVMMPVVNAPFPLLLGLQSAARRNHSATAHRGGSLLFSEQCQLPQFGGRPLARPRRSLNEPACSALLSAARSNQKRAIT